jgi:hypothetical protein
VASTADDGQVTTGSVPVPDPTKLTTDAVAALDKQIRDRLHAEREFVLSKIGNVADVTTERFRGVGGQFELNDKALIAALSAAKEAASELQKANAQAIAKSEIATQKQIDAMVQLMTTSNKSLEDKIADLKTRLDRGEGGSAGASEYRTERRLDIGQVVAVISVIAAIAFALYAALKP